MSQRVRCKICGITNLDDALAAIAAGADALGFVFYRKSPRYVEPAVAAEICAALPAFVTTVGLFVNHSREQVDAILAQVPLSLLQFHGDEDEVECLSYARPYIKAIRIRGREDFARGQIDFASAQGLLVDTYRAGVPGGTGEAFDWELLPAERNMPLILAGGLKPENVRNAIASVQPYAVDVSGGVEQSKGIKDGAKLVRFLQEVSREC